MGGAPLSIAGAVAVAITLAWQIQGSNYGDVSFSNGELLLIGALLGSVVSALGMMFRLVVKLSEARAVRAEKLVDELVLPITSTAENVEAIAKTMTDLSRSIQDVMNNPPTNGASNTGARRR